MMNARHLVTLSAFGALLCSACAARARGDDRTVVVREESLLQRMALSPDGKVVATVGVTHDGKYFNSTVKLRDLRTGQLIRAFDELKNSHVEIAFSSEFLAVAVNGNVSQPGKVYQEIRLHDPESGELKQKLDDSVAPGVDAWTAVAFSADGRRLAAAGWIEGRPILKLWHIDKGRLILRDVDVASARPEELKDRINTVRSLALSRDGRTIAAAFDDAKIRLFSAVTGEYQATLQSAGLQELPRAIAPMAFAPDSETLAYTVSNGTVELWDARERKLRRTFTAPDSRIRTIAFSPDGSRLATAGPSSHDDARGEVLIWDVRSGERKQILADRMPLLHVLAFTPDGRTLAICAGEGRDDSTGKTYTTGELRFVRLE